ncbi:MAG: 23S rRNA (pseudouridine(1915)-N(3))-methyltransferase RlmH [Christensenellales bacterium]
MKINIVAVGKIKEDFLKAAVEEYKKRISRFAEISVTELTEAPPSKSEAEQIAFESNEIVPKLKGVIIATDIAGKQLSSKELSSFIENKCVSGESEFTFVIGGSYGLDEKIKNSAALKLSFSKMTFPHQLFRVMLCEQIYRALTIKNNMPYHK